MQANNNKKQDTGKIRLICNEAIRGNEIKVIDETGKFLGSMPIKQAIDLARSKGLDLILMFPASNGLAKISDQNKFLYNLKKERKIHEKQVRESRVETKTVQFHVTTDVGDRNTKCRQIRKFLEDGCLVKLSIMMRGRENASPKMAFDMIDLVLSDLADIAETEIKPQQKGKFVEAVVKAKRK